MYTSSINMTDYRQLAIWLITFFVISFGFKYLREIIDFVLEKMYDLFIQHGLINK